MYVLFPFSQLNFLVIKLSHLTSWENAIIGKAKLSKLEERSNTHALSVLWWSKFYHIMGRVCFFVLPVSGSDSFSQSFSAPICFWAGITRPALSLMGYMMYLAEVDTRRGFLALFVQEVKPLPHCWHAKIMPCWGEDEKAFLEAVEVALASLKQSKRKLFVASNK